MYWYRSESNLRNEAYHGGIGRKVAATSVLVISRETPQWNSLHGSD